MTPTPVPASSRPPTETVPETQYSLRRANLSWVLELIREGDPRQAFYALVDSVCAQLRLEGLPETHLLNEATRKAAREVT